MIRDESASTFALHRVKLVELSRSQEREFNHSESWRLQFTCDLLESWMQAALSHKVIQEARGKTSMRAPARVPVGANFS